MNNKLNILLAIISIPLLTSCLGGLFEPKADPTEFYLLSASKTPKTVDVKGNTIINVLPISVPAYMNRKQIVVKSDDGKVDMLEFSRWAEPFQNGLTRVLLADLVDKSPNFNIYSYPSIVDGGLNLRVFVYECIGNIGGDFELSGKYQLDSVDGKIHIAKDFSINTKSGDDIKSYINVIDNSLEQLSKEIAISILEYKK